MRLLDSFDEVLSATQLGDRLHVLLARNLTDPERWVRQRLREHGLSADIEHATPNLEDVFVATTQPRAVAPDGGLPA
jgi:hypothetical protein